MTVSYDIIEVLPNVFAIIVPNQKSRAMLFIRAQEYYESPNKKYRGKIFDVEKYLEWYNCSKYAGIRCSSRAYVNDWPGFNMPYDVASRCYDKLLKRPDLMTPYDTEFYKILRYISHHKSPGKAYIIGTNSLHSPTTFHEMRHALYYMDIDYRKHTQRLLRMIPSKIYSKYKRNLKDMGYDDNVIDDELQTYIGTNDWDFPQLIKNIPRTIARELHHIFLALFKYYVVTDLKISRRTVDAM